MPTCLCSSLPEKSVQPTTYMLLYMKSSFPEHNKHYFKKRKWTCNANTKFVDCVLEKSFIHMYICTYVLIFIKHLFPKHDLQTWHWQLDIWIGAYRILEKSSSYSRAKYKNDSQCVENRLQIAVAISINI